MRTEAEENTPFSPAELAEIAAQLEEVGEILRKDGKLGARQIENAGAKLDEAGEASKRIRRKDWRLLFTGLIFTLIITDALPPDVAQHVLVLVLHGLAHLSGSGGPSRLPG